MFVCYAILETSFIFFLVLITGCILSANRALVTCVCSRLLQYPARHVRIMAKKRVITVSFLLQVTPPSNHRICPFFTFLPVVCLSGLVCNRRRFRRTLSPAEPGLQHQVACSCVRSSLRALTPVSAASYHLPECHNTPSASRFLCLTTPHNPPYSHHRERSALRARCMRVTLAQAWPPFASLRTLHSALLRIAPRSILTPRSTRLLPTSTRRRFLNTPTLIRPRACQMLRSPYYVSSEMSIQDIFHDFGVFWCAAAAAAVFSPVL